MNSIKTFILAILFNFFSLSVSYSEIINQIKIEGNNRITDEIILMFSGIDVGKDITSFEVNEINKNSYSSQIIHSCNIKI